MECWGPNSRASMCEGLMKNGSFCEQLAAKDHEFLATGDDQFNNFRNSTMEISSLLSYGSSGRYNSFSHNILPNNNNNNNNNISNSDLDLKLQVVDLLSSHKYDDINGATNYYSQAANSQISRTNLCQFFISPSTSSSNNKNSALGEAITQRKKKHRPPSSRSSSCPQLKVRKEKIREKIATLQRLAAPYGKTDTASVLTEAIGYIQSLHDQVQTLPYMSSSNRNPATSVKMSASVEDGKEQSNSDLLSRGLCLVPLSYASSYAKS